MNGIKELFDTGKGILVVLIMISVTVLYAVGKMTNDQWKETTVWAFGLYATSSALRAGLQSFGKVVPKAPAEKPAKPTPLA